MEKKMIAIIQARITSSRFPDKVLKKVFKDLFRRALWYVHCITYIVHTFSRTSHLITIHNKEYRCNILIPHSQSCQVIDHPVSFQTQKDFIKSSTNDLHPGFSMCRELQKFDSVQTWFTHGVVSRHGASLYLLYLKLGF